MMDGADTPPPSNEEQNGQMDPRNTGKRATGEASAGTTHGDESSWSPRPGPSGLNIIARDGNGTANNVSKLEGAIA